MFIFKYVINLYNLYKSYMYIYFMALVLCYSIKANEIEYFSYSRSCKSKK